MTGEVNRCYQVRIRTVVGGFLQQCPRLCNGVATEVERRALAIG
jgi:hypothetical protein